MTNAHKKEAWIVALIVLAAVIVFSYISNTHAEVVLEKPPETADLSVSDFTVSTPSGILTIGHTSRSEAMQVYPQGENLGRSGVYRPKDLDCLLTFTKHEDILVRMDLGPGGSATARGIKVGDTFDQVVAKYGSNFTKAYDKVTPNIFDAYYGADRYILFKIEDNIVQKIFIGSPII